MRTSTTATPRVRTRLAAALAICALPAATLVWAAPAHAVYTECNVNGSDVVANGQTGITGTAGNDEIFCEGRIDFSIDGQGGDDEITVVGSVVKGGHVFGGAGKDIVVVD